jgi:hypothetical protein
VAPLGRKRCSPGFGRDSVSSKVLDCQVGLQLAQGFRDDMAVAHLVVALEAQKAGALLVQAVGQFQECRIATVVKVPTKRARAALDIS